MLQVQSKEVLLRETQDMQSEVVEFVGETVGDQVIAPATLANTTNDIFVDKFHLGEFLKRPVRIAKYDIAQGESFVVRSLNPWTAYMSTPSVQKKLDNFAFFRANMHVKVVVNASPFLYGAYLVSYLPALDWVPHLNFAGNADVNTSQLVNIPFSQRKHIIVETHKNKGGDMVLPLVIPQNFSQLTAAYIAGLGQLDITQFATIRSASGTSGAVVTMQIYAWLEDLELEGQTQALAVQAKDEYMTGTVSYPASVIAGIGHRLSDVPVIGPFAKAAGFVGGAVAKVASLFGFTNVPVIDDVQPFKSVPFHAFASAHIGVPLEKLTLDPKNELSVDPRIHGGEPVDNMSINYLVNKKSWLRSGTWSPSNPVDTNLARINVTPVLAQSTANWYFGTPAENVARMFTSWRGDLKFCIKFYASQYHQGRVRITYDPLGGDGTATSANVTQTKIVDLQDTDEVTFVVPWMKPVSWANIEPSQVSNLDTTASGIESYNTEYHNGRISIDVLTQLTAPSTGSDVTFQIWWVGSDNLEFANPSHPGFLASTFKVQSKDVIMGELTGSPDERLLVNFGEDIRSTRSLLRRTCLWRRERITSTSTTVNALAIANIPRSIYPVEYGYDPNGIDTIKNQAGTASVPGNWASVTPFSWLVPMYAGMRGSMNYSFNFVGNELNEFRVSRFNETFSATAPQVNQFTTDNAVLQSTAVGSTSNEGFAGQSLVNTKTQTGLQIQMPFMSRYIWAATYPANRSLGSSKDGTNKNNYSVILARPAVTSGDGIIGTLESFYSIGTDFTLVEFISVPLRWKYSMNTA